MCRTGRQRPAWLFCVQSATKVKPWARNRSRFTLIRVQTLCFVCELKGTDAGDGAGYPGAEPASRAHQLLRSRPASRKEVARRAGISAATVTRVVDQLIADGLVVEGAEIVVENRGRRARIVDLVADRAHVVGIDLGASTTRFVVTDLIGTPVTAAVVPTPGHHEARALASWLASETAALTSGLPATPVQIALGLPGAVGEAGDQVSTAPNLPQIEDPAFLAGLRAALPAPIVIDNDANYALLGEQRFGAASAAPTAAMITLGAGLGSALAIGGRLLRGKHGLVGEFGQLPVGPFGAPSSTRSPAPASCAVLWNPASPSSRPPSSSRPGPASRSRRCVPISTRPSSWC